MAASDPLIRGAPAEGEDRDAAFVLAARARANLLYDGVVTPHRSCGIALAETFGLPTSAYQALRRGGITGQGECGAVVAGRLVLGELLGDPEPTGPVTPALREAMDHYDRRWRERLDAASPGPDRSAPLSRDIVCNTLTGVFPIFRSPERHAFCTALATEVATAVAEALVAVDGPRPDAVREGVDRGQG